MIDETGKLFRHDEGIVMMQSRRMEPQKRLGEASGFCSSIFVHTALDALSPALELVSGPGL